MKNIVAVILFLVFFMIYITVPFASRAQTSIERAPSPQVILIDEFLRQVQLALAKVQKDLAEENIPPLESVTLDLSTEAKKGVGGKINLYIISFGHKIEKGRTQEVEITLKPPSPNAKLHVAKEPGVSEQLETAIVSAALGVQNARKNTAVPLEPTQLKVTMNFVVKSDTSGGVKFEIAPVTVDLSGELTDQATQKIVIVYQKPIAKGK